MNRDDDFIGRLEDYLEDFDGVTPLPVRVRDAIHAELPRTRQARPGRGLGRMLTMISRVSTPARWGLAAAAVLAAIVLGAAFMTYGRGSPTVGAAPASPSPAASPTSRPTERPPTTLNDAPLEACFPSGPPDCLVAGTYQLSSLNDWPLQIGLTVPAGWFQWNPARGFEGVLVDSGPDAPDGSGWGLMFIRVGNVSIDPCDLSAGTFTGADMTTVDGMVSAMHQWPAFVAVTLSPTTVGGFGGQLVELTSTRTSTDCPNPVLWTTPTGASVDGYPIVTAPGPAAHSVQFKIVDVNGALLVVRTTDFPDTSPNELSQGVGADPTRHSADQIELHQILDSITVGGRPTG